MLVTPLSLRRAQTVLVLHRHAEVFQLAHVEVDAFHAEDAAENQPAVEHADGQTVGFGAAVDIFRGDQRAGAGHVLDDQWRVAGNMFAHVARHGAGVDIEAAAGAAADDDANGLAAVEFFGAATSSAVAIASRRVTIAIKRFEAISFYLPNRVNIGKQRGCQRVLRLARIVT